MPNHWPIPWPAIIVGIAFPLGTMLVYAIGHVVDTFIDRAVARTWNKGARK